jgi:hypothetical protein
MHKCPSPSTPMWSTNSRAWQLLFAIGIFAGRRFKRGGIAYDARLFAACLAVVAIAAVVRTDAFGYASGLWQDVSDVLDCGKTDLGFARLLHFLALAYIVYHSGLTGAHLTNGFAIVLAEVSYRLVVRNKPAPQPHLPFPKIISARSSDAVRTRLV